MKLAALTVALVAFSSSAAAAPPCLPRMAEPWFGASGVIVACDFMSPTVTCYEVRPDGAVKPVPTPPKPLRAEVSGRFVEICPGDGGACTTIDPEKAGDQRRWMADVDLRGKLATVVLHADGATSALVEVWDVVRPKQLAQTTLHGSGNSPLFYAWFFGRTFLIGIGTLGADDDTEYSLWKRSGTRLTQFKKLDRSPRHWVVLDDRTVVLQWDDGGVDIFDTIKGAVTHHVAWKALLPRPMPVDRVFLAKMGDRKFAIVPMDADRLALGLGVGDAKGKVTPYPVSFCP